jgi:peptide/nickel transport system substrate-binding protein
MPDAEQSRAEARRLLKETGAEGLSFEMLNRNLDQPYIIVGTWLVDEFREIGVSSSHFLNQDLANIWPDK